jgi:hypothetical protein
LSPIISSAADVFVEHLATYLPPEQMFRLNALHRAKLLPGSIINKYSIYDEEKEIYLIPPLQKLLSFRVIVTTWLVAL